MPFLASPTPTYEGTAASLGLRFTVDETNNDLAVETKYIYMYLELVFISFLNVLFRQHCSFTLVDLLQIDSE